METKDIYRIVTDLIIQKLEEGIVPWRQPWTFQGPPRNLITQRPYRGINFILLNALNYPEKQFLTFKQVQDLRGKVTKGEKAHMVVFWVWPKEDSVWMQEGPQKPLLRYYYVFNVAQCTDIPPRAFAPPTGKNEAIEVCERIVEGMPKKPNIAHLDEGAYYHPIADFINMPRMEVFESAEAYYATLFHEMIHATGYEDRLGRKEIVEHSKYGSEPYSIEELTAEIGACYLASYSGIAVNGLTNNVAYIQGWMKRLKQDKRLIVYASSQAQKAVDYILNIKREDYLIEDAIENITV